MKSTKKSKLQLNLHLHDNTLKRRVICIKKDDVQVTT